MTLTLAPIGGKIPRRPLAAALLLVLTGCVDEGGMRGLAPNPGEPVCGITEGTFRARWWNYVERAASFAVCARWSEAEADLRAAIAQRPDDQRRARTYGMHFVDYFPHRELGIVLYRQGRLEEAMRELEASLATVKSAKAELYLDRVRTDWIERNRLDRIPPDITLDSPAPGALVQGFSIRVQGQVRDDTFVKRIEVNGLPEHIDLAAKQIPFAVEVPLARSGNRIEVVATDLAGRTSRTSVQVVSDREGPVLGIQEARPGGRLQGYVEDPSGLAAVRINGEPQPLSPGGALTLDRPLPSAVQAPQLLIEAVDRAGNFTTAQIDFTERLNRRRGPPLLLARAADGGFALWAAADGAKTEDLYINYRPEGGELYLDRIYLEGHATLPAGVASVRINGIELLRRPGRTVFFSHRLALRPGANRLRLEVRDTGGRSRVQTLTLTRVLTRLERRAARYRLALVGQRPAEPAQLRPLWTALEDTPRFQPSGAGPLTSERGAELLTPQEAARLARPQGADGVLLTQIDRRRTSLEYSAQWVDAATGAPLFLIDAYTEQDLDPQPLARTLLGKVRDALPVLDGRVSGRQGPRLTLGLPGAQTLPGGVPLTLYRDPPPRRDPRTGADLGADPWILGEARLAPPGPGARQAELIGAADIRVGDRVQMR